MGYHAAYGNGFSAHSDLSWWGCSTWEKHIQSWEPVLTPDLILTSWFPKQVMGSASPSGGLDPALLLHQGDLQHFASGAHKAAQPSMRRAVLSQVAWTCASTTKVRLFLQ